MKNVAVIFGGKSIEHEISVITGTLTLNSLDTFKFNPIPIFVDKEGLWWTGEILKDLDKYKNLNKKKLTRVTLVLGEHNLYSLKNNKRKLLCPIACAINCMHGERGEDGSLSGLLNMCSIPIASPNVFCSSLCISKNQTKIMLKGLGIKTLPYVTASSTNDCPVIEQRLEYPLIVKPDTGGSSIGINTAKNKKELSSALLVALRYSKSAIVEPLLAEFEEINCACYRVGEKVVVSECEKPFARGEILSFEDKYQSGKRQFPAMIDKKISDKIKGITQEIYTKLEFDGIIRVDYIIYQGKVYVNEINTVPGSLAYYLFVKTLKEYTELLTTLINDSLVRGAKDSTLIKNFSSGILSIGGCKASKRLKK